jgi:nucleoside phosphorylase
MEDRVDEISIRSFQGLLDFQTPWGEWGASGLNDEERFKRIGRERLFVQQKKLAKPNMFRTLRGIETIKWLTPNRFNNRIDKALAWVEKQMNDGWFEAWMEDQVTPAPDQPNEISKEPDVRHTAEAIIAFIKFKRVTYDSIKAIERLLDNQLYGGAWPDYPLKRKARIYSTIFATELLYALRKGRTKNQIVKLGKGDLLERAQPALDRAKAWFFEENRKHDGQLQYCYETAMVLDRIGIDLLPDYSPLIQTLLERLYEGWDGRGWVNDGAKPEKREASRVHATLRVTSCLTWLAHNGVSVDSQILRDARQCVISRFSLDEMDTPNFVDILRIFGLEKPHFEVISNADYYDYFTEDETATLINKGRQREIFELWLGQFATRLAKLEVEKEAGVMDYASAHKEEKTKLCLILRAFAKISENQDIIEELALNLDRASNAEAFISNVSRMDIAKKSPDLLQKIAEFDNATAYSIYTELPNLIAELLKSEAVNSSLSTELRKESTTQQQNLKACQQQIGDSGFMVRDKFTAPISQNPEREKKPAVRSKRSRKRDDTSTANQQRKTQTTAATPSGQKQAINSSVKEEQQVSTGTQLQLDDVKGKVDFAIITIREDEFRAVLDRLPERRVLRKSSRYYSVSRIEASNNVSYLTATVRCVEQGTGEAQTVASNIIRDLDPKWILAVGIAGGVPSTEFSLGDVVLSTRVNDFTVGAVFESAPPAYAISGGATKREVADLVAFIPALDHVLSGWNTTSSIGQERPQVTIPLSRKSLYGDPDWKRKILESLTHHFDPDNSARLALVTSGPIDSSDLLIKDTKTLKTWLRLTRNAVAVEMESAGIYRAARNGDKEYPFLAIRGISDIIGLKRDDRWTSYACKSAAAFAVALIKSGIIESRNATTI